MGSVSDHCNKVNVTLKQVTQILCSPSAYKSYVYRGFPGGAVVENLPANAGDRGSSPGLGRSHMPRSN